MIHLTLNRDISRSTILARRLLRADGIVVLTGGAALIIGAGPVASALDVASRWPLTVVGALCIPYGLWLSWAAGRTPGSALRRLTATIATANVIWVLLSGVLFGFLASDFSQAGRWLMVGQAGVVLAFAASEAWSARRLA